MIDAHVHLLMFKVHFLLCVHNDDDGGSTAFTTFSCEIKRISKHKNYAKEYYFTPAEKSTDWFDNHSLFLRKKLFEYNFSRNLGLKVEVIFF